MQGHSRSTSQPDGGFVATNVTLRGLIVDAYPFKSFQVTGGPAWIDSDRFDIVAKAPEKSTEDEYQTRLRYVLEDRFKIVL